MKLPLHNLSGIKILLVDDDLFIIDVLRGCLSELNCEIFSANNGEEALALMADTEIDLVISDMEMPKMNGEQLMQEIARIYPETIRIILTGSPEFSSILSAVNSGHIWGYMQKPWDTEQLIVAIEQAVFTQRAMVERSQLRFTLDHYQRIQKNRFQGFIGESLAMQFVYKAIENAAPSNASVFITGPSGAGKELVAQAIHNLSKRRENKLITLNCAAIPKELMESEIFGHVKGAFTGAVSTRDGAACLADGGTLFFDELGEMDIGLQAKLLRFIQTGSYQRVGSDKTEKVNIRFICATNRDPLEAIAEKRLREDLYYRLNVVGIDLPPLAQRDNDALLLAHHFLNTFATEENKTFIGITSDARDFLVHYSWPGNVRQLRNCIHNCVIMSDGPLLTRASLENALNFSITQLQQTTPPATPSSPTHDIGLATTIADIKPLNEIEREAIQKALLAHEGNVVNAANALEVSPSTLYRKMSQWENS